MGQYYSGVDSSSIKLWDGCVRVHYTSYFVCLQCSLENIIKGGRQGKSYLERHL